MSNIFPPMVRQTSTYGTPNFHLWYAKLPPMVRQTSTYKSTKLDLIN